MSSKTQREQLERFQKYMAAPCTELHEKDAGRGDPHRVAFQEWGVPEEFLLWLWQAAEAAALELAAQACDALAVQQDEDMKLFEDERHGVYAKKYRNAAATVRALATPVEREGDKS